MTTFALCANPSIGVEVISDATGDRPLVYTGIWYWIEQATGRQITE